jgi:hypothetical protein
MINFRTLPIFLTFKPLYRMYKDHYVYSINSNVQITIFYSVTLCSCLNTEVSKEHWIEVRRVGRLNCTWPSPAQSLLLHRGQENMDLRIHSSIRLHGVVLSWLSTGTALPYFFYFCHWHSNPSQFLPCHAVQSEPIEKPQKRHGRLPISNKQWPMYTVSTGVSVSGTAFLFSVYLLHIVQISASEV